MEQQLEILPKNNLGEATVEYTKVPIVGVKSEYDHNEDLELHFKRANRYLDLNSVSLVF